MIINILIKKTVFVLLFASFLTKSLSAKEKVYVFYPTVFNAKSINDKLVNHIEGVDIIVFGKYDDFIKRVNTEPSDAIITKTLLIHDQIGDYEILLTGVRNSKTEANFVIISIEKPLKIESVNSTTVIGAINILGRARMKSFVERFFPATPRIKRVSKIGDLLPLLSLNMANGIMVENVFVDYFKSTSKMNFFITPLPPISNGTVSFAVKKGENAEKTLTILKANNKKICDIFHIEKWE